MLVLDIVNLPLPHGGTGHIDVGMSIVIVVTCVIGAVTGILTFASVRRDGYGRVPERTPAEAERARRD